MSASRPVASHAPRGGQETSGAALRFLESHGNGTPSDWITRWSHLIPAGGTLLDVACGSGRHLRWAAARGLSVTGVDRDAAALAPLRPIGTMVVADIEDGAWPFPGRQFDAMVVTNYLWRPLLPTLFDSVAPGGVMLYETFADGHQTVGKPSRPDFLLQPGELLAAALGLRVVAYEDGFRPSPDRFVQRIAACRPAAPGHGLVPVRYTLPPLPLAGG